MGQAVKDQLGRNERLVLDALLAADKPMKAYQLLEQLSCDGIKAPMTIYRALERLEGRGLVHKLDRLNAFIACRNGKAHRVEIFLLCNKCSAVSEIEESNPSAISWESIIALATPWSFDAEQCRVEINGCCPSCAS